jgi:hypothetical protein
VRLDHLLSKEHLASTDAQEPNGPRVRAGVLEGGDTGECTAGNGSGVSTTGAGAPGRGCRCGAGKHAGCGWRWMMGTLLGPEGTTRSRPRSGVGAGVGREAGRGLLFR